MTQSDGNNQGRGGRMEQTVVAKSVADIVAVVNAVALRGNDLREGRRKRKS